MNVRECFEKGLLVKARVGKETVKSVSSADNVGYSSIALDSNDNPHISYYRHCHIAPILRLDQDLKYAKLTETGMLLTVTSD